MDLTEAEDIKKRWQEYTEELYKKDLHDQDNHDGVITDLEPDILECEVTALGSITTNKASGGDGIPVELCQILKGRGTRDQFANIRWIIRKAREFQKNIYSPLLTTPKPLTVWTTTNWKILKEMGTDG